MVTIVAQIVGLVGIGLLIAIFQVDNRDKMLRLLVINCLVWALYYFLMGAYTGAGLVLLGAVRSYVFARYRDQEWVYGATIVACIIVTLSVWGTWTSLLALTGMILNTTALWQKDPRAIRMLSLSVTPFWLSYNYLSGSYFGMAGDLVTFTSVVVGIIRFDISPWLRRNLRYMRGGKTDKYTEVSEA